MAVTVPHPPAFLGVAPDASLPRRAVLGLWGAIVGGTALAGAGALAYLWPAGPYGTGDAGLASEYERGAVRYFPGTDPESGFSRRSFFVVRLAGRADGFVAFEALCAHEVGPERRCLLSWRADRQFFCACHGGSWWQETGEPVLQPDPRMPTFIPHHVPPRRLIALPVQIVRGRVVAGPRAGAEHRRGPHRQAPAP